MIDSTIEMYTNSFKCVTNQKAVLFISYPLIGRQFKEMRVHINNSFLKMSKPLSLYPFPISTYFYISIQLTQIEVMNKIIIDY